jgi:hypothetical protein
VLLVAGGGGGGGGGSALFIGYNGGAGGTDAPGFAGVGPFGGSTGRAGSMTICTPPVIGDGEAGESSPSGLSVGGGGGGGGGTCGGQGGGSGDHGAGSGGGGGGGAGGSYATGTASPFTPGTNSGDGSATVGFQLPPAQAPTILGTGCIFDTAPSFSWFIEATGYPAPTLELLGAPSGFTFGNVVSTDTSTTGAVSTGPQVPGDYRMALVATNASGSTSQPLAVEVTSGSASPSFVSLPSATAQVGTPFGFDVRAVACPVLTGFHLADASGISWLSIDSAGHLAGTPPPGSEGTHTFTIVADGQPTSPTLSQSFTLTVQPAALAVTTGLLPGGQAGAPYAATLEATGGTGPYTWSLTPGSTLPDGLTLHSDGTIGGTPTGPSTTTVGFTVTDAGSPPLTATASLYLPVQSQPVAAIAVLPPDLPTGRVGTPYTGQLHASGGSGTLQWALAPGATLPPGLVLAPSGAITGTPTASGSTSVAFVVADSGGPATASATYPLTVGPAALAVTTTTLPAASVGIPYRATLAASGGTGPYRWTWAPRSARPAGLTLHANGVLDGTPTAAGTRTLKVVVADAGSPRLTAGASVSLSIGPRPRVPDLALALAHMGSVTGFPAGLAAQVRNNGTGPTTAPVTLSLQLPGGLRPAAAGGPGWACRIDGGTVTCTHAGALRAGGRSAVAVLARVTAPAGSTLVSTATVGPADATPADNSASDRIRVTTRR